MSPAAKKVSTIYLVITRSTDPIVLHAIPVFGIHMLLPGLLEVEMLVALLAVVVIRVLYIVLPQGVIALKVEVAVIAGPMRIGILLVLLESTIVPKPSFAAVTICCHDCGELKKRGVGSCVGFGRQQGTWSHFYVNYYYAIPPFSHVTPFSHFDKFALINPFSLVSPPQKKPLHKVCIIDRGS